jgi:D-glycero-alpha-D-manno-heptose-7-phosphate kinase
MIISQTPLRISLFGGGTDFPEYFNYNSGAVLSMAIDKYVYIIVKERFDNKVYLNYSQKEVVDNVDDLKHDLIRESLKWTNVTKGVEIVIMSDVPAGTGLGSSSSLLVGLLNALYSYRGIQPSAQNLAEESSIIELDILRKPIGIQDQYIAAYGGFKFFEFISKTYQKHHNITYIHLPPLVRKELLNNFLLLYIGNPRNSEDILAEQRSKIDSNIKILDRMKQIAFEGKRVFTERDTVYWGDIPILLKDSWTLKKALASTISNDYVDAIYKIALWHGAIAGKLLGAGGGGFLLLYCPRYKEEVKLFLPEYPEIKFDISDFGSRIIFNNK